LEHGLSAASISQLETRAPLKLELQIPHSYKMSTLINVSFPHGGILRIGFSLAQIDVILSSQVTKENKYGKLLLKKLNATAENYNSWLTLLDPIIGTGVHV